MNWNQIPAEIFDIIVRDLELNDIKNLRLVNKASAERCLGPRLLSFASTAETDLTEQSLWDLMAHSLHPAFGPAVRKLRVLSICFDHVGKHVVFEFNSSPAPAWGGSWWDDLRSITVPSATYDMNWLREQQQIRDSLSDQVIIDFLGPAISSFTGLENVTLRSWVTTSPGQKWPPYEGFAPVTARWTSHVCYLTLAAVAGSKTTAKSLNLFTEAETPAERGSNVRTYPQICSGVLWRELSSHVTKIHQTYGEIQLPFDDLSIQVRAEDDAIKQTSTSMFPSLFSASSSNDEAKDDFSSLTRLLRLMPGLRNLDVCFNQKGRCNPVYYGHIFTGIAELSFPQLRNLHLQNLSITSAAILRFLKSHRMIHHLYLEGLSIPADEEWGPVFSFLSEEMKDLLVLVLSECFRGESQIRLYPDVFFKQYFTTRPFLPISSVNNSGPDLHMIFPYGIAAKAAKEKGQWE
ncbi:hypothetical protein N7492_002566 [Penicillium capsulatum]|uniref:F-box domain-containing protein n=1 Tax=Penicillium capsulatum TaxID=69766 RepID=A0A9W9IPC1_9EURO|nr:hypothetical protein N7492_002566 [Penicillium capsulatum]KAJ6122831.1 hypothetical protein N7512_005296 [Penicillium capsulatum]